AGAAESGRLDSWSAGHLNELAELELSWPDLLAGDTLLHADIRADNVLLANDQVLFVDWPHACIGAAVADVAFMAPSVTMRGGPWGGGARRAGAGAGRRAGGGGGRAAVGAAAGARAGYFPERAPPPPPLGLPTLRAFQAAQGEIARRWLAGLLR